MALALPTSYTDATLAAFMHQEIGPLATALSWTVAGGSYDEPILDTLVLASVDAVASLAVQQARLLSRVAVWRQVVKHLGADRDFTNDGLSFSESGALEHAQACLLDAENEANTEGYLDTLTIKRDTIEFLEDPYETAFIDPQGRDGY